MKLPSSNGKVNPSTLWEVGVTGRNFGVAETKFDISFDKLNIEVLPVLTTLQLYVQSILSLYT